jgi:hypothetical protein
MLQTVRLPVAPLPSQQCGARQLRDKAAQCFRLAGSITDDAVIAQLRRIGSEFAAKAARLEAGFLD